MRRLVSIWLPNWPIERLRQRRHMQTLDPADPPGGMDLVHGRAFVLVTTTAHGLRITAANARARHEGIWVGMALADARAMLPSLQSAPACHDADREGLEKLARWCGRYGPARNVDGADRLWIDVTGVAPLFAAAAAAATEHGNYNAGTGQAGPAVRGQDAAPRSGAQQFHEERLMLADMINKLRGFGLSPRIGLADTLGAAHALASFGIGDHEHSAIARPGGGRKALRGLPVEGLRLDAAALLLLKRLGLRRIGQLYDIPRQGLERRFRDGARAGRRRGIITKSKTTQIGAASQAVLWRLDQALGLIGEPRKPLSEPVCYNVRRDYPDLLISSDALIHEIAGLVEALCAKLKAAGRGARRLQLFVYRADGSQAQITIGTSFPSRDPSHIMRLFNENLGELDAGFGVDILTLQAPDVEVLREKQGALDAAVTAIAANGTHFRQPPGGSTMLPAKSQQARAQLLDALINRIGASHVYSLKCNPSHDPERAHSKQPALSFISGCLPAHSNDLAIDQAPAPGRRRPCLLLCRPEPIAALAPMSDGPPKQFIWRRVTRYIVKAVGPERIGNEWWRHLPRCSDGETDMMGAAQSTGSAQSDEGKGAGVAAQSGRDVRPGQPASLISSDSSSSPLSPGAAFAGMASLAGGASRDYYHVEDRQGARYWLFCLRPCGWQLGASAQVGTEPAPRWFMHGVFA